MRPVPVLVLILLLGLGLRLGVIAQDLETLVARVVPDDAFIYYQVARHLAHGDGATFDGITGTNGFHPLWMGVLVPVFAAVDGLAAVRLALSLCAALDAVSLVLLFLLARRLTGSAWWALVPGVLWYLCPLAVREGLNGMETALSLTVALGTLLLYQGLPERPSLRQGLLLGVLGGLCLLARTDQVFLVGVLLLAMVRRAPGPAVAAGAVAVALLAPFLAWNQAVFGSPVQASASAYPLVIVANHLQQFGTGVEATVGKSWDMLWATFVEFPPIMTGLRWLYWVLLAGLAAFWMGCRDEPRRAGGATLRAGARFLALPLLALVLLGLFHAGFRWFPRRWYFFLLDPLVSLYAALLFAWLAERWGRRGTAVALAFLTVSLGWFGFEAHRLATREDSGYPWQGEMLLAARWIDENVPAGERVGSFNAGIVAFFSQRTVVNLDGLGNDRALRALRERRLADLVEEMDLRWLADFEYSVHRDYRLFYGRDLPLEPVAEIDLPGVSWSGSAYRIWRLRPPRGVSVETSVRLEASDAR